MTLSLRVLSIDRGGTTAIVSSASLIHLEEQIRLKIGDSNARIVNFFDIVDDTGIGAILASMLVADDSCRKPLFSAREAISFVAKNNSEIFRVKAAEFLWWRRILSDKSMNKALKEAFRGEGGTILTLRDTCTDRKKSCIAIDGGLVMNNPTAVALTYVLHNELDFPLVNGVEDLLILSLGNGLLSGSPLSVITTLLKK